MTTKQVQIRRDTATNLNAATPAEGEMGFDKTNKRFVVGDGLAAGGIPHASAADIQKQSFVYPTVGGTANAITLTNTYPVLVYAAPLKQVFKATASNTTAVTVNVDGLGTKNVKKMNNGALADLVANDIISGGIYEIWYDGTQFQIKGLAEGPFSSGALKFLGSATASSSATVDLLSLLTSTYDEYLVNIQNLNVATNGTQLLLRASPDNSTFDAGSKYDYMARGITSAAVNYQSGGSASTSILLGSGLLSTGGGLSGSLRLYGVNSTTRSKLIEGTFTTTLQSGGSVSYVFGAIWQDTANTLQALRFFALSGNIDSGTIRVYGIAKS